VRRYREHEQRLSFEFPFDVTARHEGRWLGRTRASRGNVVELEAIGVM
jgi:hypothetical protein